MTNIVVPELGESVVEARVARWQQKEGDDVKIGELLAVLDESAAAPATRPSGNGSDRGPERSAPPVAVASPAQPASPAPDTRATPTARRMAREHDVDLGAVQGSGSAGRVMKQDVQGAIAPAP